MRALSFPVTQRGGGALDVSSQKNIGLSSIPSLLMKLPGTEYKLGTKKREGKKNRRETEMHQGGVSAACPGQCRLCFIRAGRSTLIFLIIEVAQRS